MIDDDLSDQDLENREVLGNAIRDHQAEAAKAMLDVDIQYRELKNWWAVARVEFERKALQDKMRMERADGVAIIMYMAASKHPTTDLALMLASRVFDDVEKGQQ